MRPLRTVYLAFLLSAGAGGLAAAPVQPPAAGGRDWTWVQGAVFVPTNCVNEAQQWDEYDPAVNDRELHYASAYGINVVRVYLHYLRLPEEEGRAARRHRGFPRPGRQVRDKD